MLEVKQVHVAFKNQLIYQNIDLDPKVMTTERNMQRVAKQ